jgi:hypothetical protein
LVKYDREVVSMKFYKQWAINILMIVAATGILSLLGVDRQIAVIIAMIVVNSIPMVVPIYVQQRPFPIERPVSPPPVGKKKHLTVYDGGKPSA